MPRLLFEKTGNAVWMSHLDLMRLFQRGFKRAGLNLKHTQGFNPRPLVSIALPMSVGVHSRCELLDFDLDGQDVSNDEIMTRLNGALVDGVTVFDVYDNGDKIRDLALLDAEVTLEYDNGVADDAISQLRSLFERGALLVEKKSKNGVTEQDIIPMIRRIAVDKVDDHVVCIRARVCCQNPSLNPMQLVAAVERYLPHLRPDFASSFRIEIYNNENKIFR